MFGAIQDLYPQPPYIRSSDAPPAPIMPGLQPLEQAIARNLEDELYRRGYGNERFGNLGLPRGTKGESSTWLWALLAAIGVVWLWKT